MLLKDLSPIIILLVTSVCKEESETARLNTFGHLDYSKAPKETERTKRETLQEDCLSFDKMGGEGKAGRGGAKLFSQWKANHKLRGTDDSIESLTSAAYFIPSTACSEPASSLDPQWK